MESSRSKISAMIQNSFPPALHHARLAGSSTSRLRPALLRSVETSSPVSAPRHSKPCRAIPASVAAMKCQIPFKASVAGGKVAGHGVVEAHPHQETSWPNQALQPTCNPPLRSRSHAAELGRWTPGSVAIAPARRCQKTTTRCRRGAAPAQTILGTVVVPRRSNRTPNERGHVRFRRPSALVCP